MKSILNLLHLLGLILIVWGALCLIVLFPTSGLSMFHPTVVFMSFTVSFTLILWLRYFPLITGGNLNNINWEKRGLGARYLDRKFQEWKSKDL